MVELVYYWYCYADDNNVTTAAWELYSILLYYIFYRMVLYCIVEVIALL